MYSYLLVLIVVGSTTTTPATVAQLPMQDLAACTLAETNLGVLHDQKALSQTFVMTCVKTY